MAKRFIVVGLVVIAVCANVFAILGPPTAELKKGEWNGGFNYTYLNMDLDKTSAKWSEYEDGSLDDSGTAILRFKDVRTDLYYGNLGYGIEDWWQVYVQLGISDLKDKAKGEGDIGVGDLYLGEWTSFDFGKDFAWGWGTKVTFAKQDNVDWGVGVQMNWLNTHYEKTGASGVLGEGESNETHKTNVDLTAYNLIVAVGPTVDMGGWKLYGGPFYTYLSGEAKGRYNESGNDPNAYTFAAKGKADIKSDDHFGGYIGAQFNVAENCDFTTEFALTGKGAWSLGAGIAWKF